MNTARWMPWRRRRPVAEAARTIASWDAAIRLQARAHLLWLAQQISEARTTAQAALDQPQAAPARLPDVLDLTLAPQLHADHMPSGAQQLADAVHEARRAAGQLATATPRAARRTLTRLADDLAQADEFLEHACHDVRGADLRSADLTHLYLGGLRWNESTQWPERQREQIDTDSDLIDGIHQIRDR